MIDTAANKRSGRPFVLSQQIDNETNQWVGNCMQLTHHGTTPAIQKAQL